MTADFDGDTINDELLMRFCGNPDPHLPHMFQDAVNWPEIACSGLPGVASRSVLETFSEDLSDVGKYVEQWLEENLEQVVTEIFERRLQKKQSEGHFLESLKISVLLNKLTGKDYYDTQG